MTDPVEPTEDQITAFIIATTGFCPRDGDYRDFIRTGLAAALQSSPVEPTEEQIQRARLKLEEKSGELMPMEWMREVLIAALQSSPVVRDEPLGWAVLIGDAVFDVYKYQQHANENGPVGDGPRARKIVPLYARAVSQSSPPPVTGELETIDREEIIRRLRAKPYQPHVAAEIAGLILGESACVNVAPPVTGEPTQAQIEAGMNCMVMERGVTQFTASDLVAAYKAMHRADTATDNGGQ